MSGLGRTKVPSRPSNQSFGFVTVSDQRSRFFRQGLHDVTGCQRPRHLECTRHPTQPPKRCFTIQVGRTTKERSSSGGSFFTISFSLLTFFVPFLTGFRRSSSYSKMGGSTPFYSRFPRSGLPLGVPYRDRLDLSVTRTLRPVNRPLAGGGRAHSDLGTHEQECRDRAAVTDVLALQCAMLQDGC